MTTLTNENGLPDSGDGGTTVRRNEVPVAKSVGVCPGPPEMVTAWKQGELEYLTASDGVRLPVRTFGSSGTGTPVVLLHGLQSHSGWFVQSSCHIASLGCPVYALDRRGSGLSRQQRGHAASFRQIADDIGHVVQHAAKRHGAGQVHIVGHCFGAIAAVLFACDHPAILASLILATPALYTRVTVPLADKAAVAVSRLRNSMRYLPIPFPTDLLTELPAYRSFIRQDSLSLDELTATSYYQIFRARLLLAAKASRLYTPVFMALAGKDRISHNRKNETFFRRIPAAHKKLATYTNATHILEFSPERETFFQDLSEWIAGVSSHDSGGRATRVTER